MPHNRGQHPTQHLIGVGRQCGCLVEVINRIVVIEMTVFHAGQVILVADICTEKNNRSVFSGATEYSACSSGVRNIHEYPEYANRPFWSIQWSIREGGTLG